MTQVNMLVPEQTEQSFIAGLLQTPETVCELDPEDIATPWVRHIYRAVTKAQSEGLTLDTFALLAELEAANLLVAAGGVETVMELARNGVGTNLDRRAQIIRDKAAARRLIPVAHQIEREARELPIADAVANAHAALDTVERKRSVGDSLDDGIVRVLGEIDHGLEHGIDRIPTGLRNLDHILGGMGKGDLILLGARPSHGKSALAMQIAMHVAGQGLTVPFFSLEMSTSQLVKRILASTAGVDHSRLRDYQLQQDDFASLSGAVVSLKNKKLIIVDDAQQTVGKIRSTARKLREAPGLVVIDYLQLMEGEGDNRREEIGGISRGLKRLARDLECPVLVLSQLSRKCEERANKRPMPSDLREDGSLEQDADSILLMYREAVYTMEPDGLTEVIVGKNRSGEIGTAYLEFVGRHMRFTDTHRRPVSGKAKGF